jgi:multimeric flavodoxin WrbA
LEDFIMAKVLVVYCSLSGNTETAAQAVADGARSAGAEVVLKTASQAGPEDLQACDAVALGSYDAFSYMGGALKDFFDRSFYPTHDEVTDKPYVAFVTHGGKGKAIASIESVATTFKFKKVAEPVVVQGRPDGQGTEQLKALGARLAGATKG